MGTPSVVEISLINERAPITYKRSEEYAQKDALGG